MRVLLADDQSWLRSALRLLLEHEENVEVVGETGVTGLLPTFIRHLCPDLLFLDWQLSGLETNSKRRQLVDSLRAIEPNLYIIALTNDDNVTACLLAGADAVVNLAEPPEKVLSVLQRAASRILTRPSEVAGSQPLL
jgi:DNA-binding NarL/FixJ family response regulator